MKQASSRTASHLGGVHADTAENAPRHIAAAEPSWEEALLPPARAVRTFAVTGMASEANTSERHTKAEVALQEAVAARLFDRKAYSDRWQPSCTLTESFFLLRHFASCQGL